jgi:hypothetical protein
MSARRSFLAALAAVCLAPLIAAAGASAPVNVVKIISFDCGVCLASDSLDGPIQAAVESHGGRFVTAPLPRVETDARERLYYALRDVSPRVEFKTREALFKGSQELSYPLAELADTLDFLRQEVGEDATDWDRVVTIAQSPSGREPINRAIRLVANSGAQVTPTYVLVREGSVLGTYDVNSVPNTNLSSLREAVLGAIQRVSQATAKE